MAAGWAGEDSNLRLPGYEPVALTAELPARRVQGYGSHETAITVRSAAKAGPAPACDHVEPANAPSRVSAETRRAAFACFDCPCSVVASSGHLAAVQQPV